MIPAPGETPGEWWGATGWSAQRDHARFDAERRLPARRARGRARRRRAPPAPRGRHRLRPAVRVRALAGRPDDACWPAATTASSRSPSSARSRASGSGSSVVEVPGGHLAALSQPEAVAARHHRLSALNRSGSARMSISTIRPPAIVNPATANAPLRRRHDEARGAVDERGPRDAARATRRSRPGRSRRAAPRITCIAPSRSTRRTTSGSSTASSASKSPSRAAARNASTISRWRARSASGSGVAAAHAAPGAAGELPRGGRRAVHDRRDRLERHARTGRAGRTRAAPPGVSVSSTTSSASPTGRPAAPRPPGRR